MMGRVGLRCRSGQKREDERGGAQKADQREWHERGEGRAMICN